MIGDVIIDPLGQGCQTQSLEGHSPTELSSNAN